MYGSLPDPPACEGLAPRLVRILKQKSLGQATMVSDFIEEATGDYLRHDGDEARVFL